MVSTQHSALSTQHSALNTRSILVLLILFLLLSGTPSKAEETLVPATQIWQTTAELPAGYVVTANPSSPASGCSEILQAYQSYVGGSAALTSTLIPAGPLFINIWICQINRVLADGTVLINYFPGGSIAQGYVCPSLLWVLDTYNFLPIIMCRGVTNVPTLIGYFNGVANTERTARDSLDRLSREYRATYKTKALVYDLFYNQTTCELGAFRIGKIPCLEDIAEVFEQRTSELNSGLKNRWEHFWEMLSGRTGQDGSLTATLTSKLGKFGEAILQLLDNIYSLIINQFVGSLPMLLNSLNGTPTLGDNARHVLKLKTYADKGSGMVLIAHSQGNLFVNAAYDGLKTAAPAAKVKVVHVAPASPTMRGGYALADVDYVIRTLRQLVTGLPSVNIELPLSANDRTGHSFEGTYLDVSRKAYERVKTMINTALDGV